MPLLCAKLPVETAILDGEVVVLAQDGTTSFADLQAAFQEGVKKPLSYFAFDLLHLDGHNLRGSASGRAKDVCSATLLERQRRSILRLSEHIESERRGDLPARPASCMRGDRFEARGRQIFERPKRRLVEAEVRS